MFPSLVNCCTIDWFTEWPEDALEKVATKFLEDMDMDDEVIVFYLFDSLLSYLTIFQYLYVLFPTSRFDEIV